MSKPNTQNHLLNLRLIILSFLSLFFCDAFSQTDFYFSSVSTKDGLSQNSISHILQDRDGTIWLGNQVGVDRYLGNQINSIDKLKKELTDIITCLYDYNDTYLWVATEKHNYLINKKKISEVQEKNNSDLPTNIIYIQHLSSTPHNIFLLITPLKIFLWNDDNNTLSEKGSFDSPIQTITKGKDNTIFLGRKEGLFSFRYYPQSNREFPLSNHPIEHSVTALHYSHDQHILFLGGDNIDVKYITQEKIANLDWELTNIENIETKDIAIPTSKVNALYFDNNQNLWIGTEASGLYIYNLASKQTTISHANCTQHTTPKIDNNKILTINATKDGVIGIGLDLEGLNIYQPEKQNFQYHFTGEDFIRKVGKDSLIAYNNQTLSIYALKKDTILIGSKDNGIYSYDLKNREIINNYLPEKDNRPAKEVLAISSGFDQRLIIGTSDGIYNLDKQTLLKFPKEDILYETITLEGNSISILYKDVLLKQFWAAHKMSDTIFIFDENFNFKEILTVPKEGKVSTILTQIIKEDTITLIGTDIGLFSKRTNGLIEPIIERPLHILSVHYREKENVLWFGTAGNGVFEYDFNKKIIQDSLCRKEGLTPEVIYSLLPDQYGNYWCSTNHGVYSINPDNKLVNHYTYQETRNLQDNEFNFGAYACWGDSILFLGGINGFNEIRPNPFPIIDTLENTTLVHYKLGATDVFASTKEDFIDFKQKTLPIIELPSEFGFISLTPTLPHYQNILNNQFRIKVGEGIDVDYIWPNEKGEIVFDQYKFKIFGNNYIRFQYRTAYSHWQDAKPINFNRFFLAWRYILSIILAILLLSLIILYFLRKNKKIEQEKIRQREINIRQQELNAQQQQVFSQQTKINVLQKKINEISRLEDIEALCQKALIHYTEDLGYDYAIISLIDFEEGKIRTKKGKSKITGITNPEEWKDMSDYPLNHLDILAQTAKLGESVIVINNDYISNPKIKRNPLLFNPNITQEGHDKLSRIFVPIKHRTTLEDVYLAQNEFGAKEEDVVMGVMEVGFKSDISEPFSKIFPDKERGILQHLQNEQTNISLYTDNFAQPYYRAYIKKKRQDLYDLLRKVEEKNHEDHFQFMNAAIACIIEWTNAKCGGIAFHNFNKTKFDFKDKKTYCGYPADALENGYNKFKEDNDGKKGITNWVAENKKPYYAKDVNIDKLYIKIHDDIESEIAIPLTNEYNQLIGVLNFQTNTDNIRFNKVFANIFRRVVVRLTEMFLKQKRYNTIKRLVEPYDVYTATETDIYRNAVQSLQDYFDAEYICVWERILLTKYDFRISRATTKDFITLFRENKFETSRITKNHSEYSNPEEIIQLQQVEAYPNKTAKIYQFCIQQKFKSYLILKIVIDSKYQAFINIFSKRKIEEREITEYSKKFLEQIHKKVANAIQGIRLFKLIEEFSQTYKEKETKDTLQKLVEQAFELLPSTDSIVLFPYKKGKTITMAERVIAGNYIEAGKKKSKRSASLANWIIKNGSRYISEHNFDQIAEQLPPIQRTDKSDFFWHRNKLKAVAAVRLEYQKEPIGVMFFNYQKELAFDEEDQRYFNAFTNLATATLLSENFIKRIKEERKKLEQEKNSIQFEYEKVYEKVLEMMPMVTKASYYMILQGINHDIRNFLQSMQRAIDAIQDEDISANLERVLTKRTNDLNFAIDSINNLLDLFAYKKGQQKEVIEVKELIEKIVFFFSRRDKLISFDFVYTCKKKTIFGLKEEFSMAIYNLINNAVQAIQAQGKKFLGNINIRVHCNSSIFEITIGDNGIGIPKEKLEDIFTLGYTTKNEGIGIGLFFVKEVFELTFKGTIEVTSNKNKGTKFLIKIPIK